MQLSGLLLAVFATVLVSPTLACKCLNNSIATAFCCGHTNGISQFGDDCKADSIGGRFGTFSNCCRNSWGLNSDCN
ncbi:hypothetical protein GQ44DRAFT_613341 [Phaeosphaeriaceae sp. PMI808]|nr:hypothetical protein GQ44DRAFT_613341 [Phaeosphaeriaceae sp. PMI808]